MCQTPASEQANEQGHVIAQVGQSVQKVETHAIGSSYLSISISQEESDLAVDVPTHIVFSYWTLEDKTLHTPRILELRWSRLSSKLRSSPPS